MGRMVASFERLRWGSIRAHSGEESKSPSAENMAVSPRLQLAELAGLKTSSISRSSPPVYLPSLSCILEHTFGLRERSIRLHGFLFDDLQSALKGFIFGLQTESEFMN